MARPRAFDTDTVLDKVTELFWQQGYDGTSLDDLDKATGLGRGSLYNAFGDKHALYLASLDHYGRQEVGAAVEMLTLGKASYKAIHRLFQSVVEAAARPGARRGCLLCNAAIELAPHDPKVEARVIANFEPLRAAFSSALATHPNLSEAKTRRQVAELTDGLTASYMGLLVMTKAGYPATVLRNAARTALAVIK